MDTFTAIADPNRRHIIELLAENGQLSASDISGSFTISPQAISQHLKVLREANVVTVEKKAQQRIYRLNEESIAEVEAWAHRYRQLWSKRFEKLDGLLQARMVQNRPHKKPKKGMDNDDGIE
ncbi:ArsR/SmtB family transcription factor [Paenibacillus sacheonensis]|uniref:Metalloregulator ArsR/SmtB family transcription factor n=1 Tax=Paenibacillus sacheonensis TaxID=742054 RepID=A0A7X4YUC1_9BACL|nr:metalloregulator ArsR/SmtB family transcription factor [Paenibacillus sacheonensis]MBM7566972.1 DNA-binding transcriptional ArsR family regulator [Paenibacillus sacheonensis]NBC71594.1 metalloregulator ArsR/SmtB family transcription factor [Paenibacillus sacheonensis]